MTEKVDPKSDDPAERAIAEALESVERLERESKGESEDDIDLDSIEVLKAGDAPPSASEDASDAPVLDTRAAASMDDDDEEEEILIDTGDDADEDEPPKKKPGGDPMLAAMITAKNELQNVLEQTQKEAKSMRERLMRVSADFENFKKRQTREREQAIKFANEGVLKELLPVLDNMDRAVVAARGNADDLADAGKNVLQGIEMVLKQFVDTLGKFGVVGFSALGEPFDPMKHEAMSQREDDTVPSGTVVEEYQRGYMLHDRLARPAMVIVSTGGPKAGTDAKTDGAEDAAASEEE
jgi:molecular chaperone GrpE